MHPVRKTTAGNLSIAYYEAGPPSGTPVFLMHGPTGAEKLIGKCAKNKCTKQISASDQISLASCKVGVTKNQIRVASTQSPCRWAMLASAA